MPADPLIVTLALDAAAQARFDALRAAHFPPERLMVGAHVTLFHALPGDRIEVTAECLERVAAEVTAFAVRVASVLFLGRGVAFELHSPALTALRERLRRGWADRLTAQDRQGWRPHVTIQNKVAAAAAKTLHGTLKAGFVPYSVTATGLALWHYRGGPWEAAGRFEFQNQA